MNSCEEDFFLKIESLLEREDLTYGDVIDAVMWDSDDESSDSDSPAAATAAATAAAAASVSASDGDEGADCASDGTKSGDDRDDGDNDDLWVVQVPIIMFCFVTSL